MNLFKKVQQNLAIKCFAASGAIGITSFVGIYLYKKYKPDSDVTIASGIAIGVAVVPAYVGYKLYP
jgi:hypothetical protein